MTKRETFWSRRKQAVEAEALQEAAAQQAAEDARVLAEQDAKADEDILRELNLPDPDTLKPGDDFSAFMAKSVPARLRSRALRKLWTSNPVLANLDGLVDYAEDFTDTGNATAALQTSYQVGKGLLKHTEELARQTAAKAAPADADITAEADAADAPSDAAAADTDAGSPAAAEPDPTRPKRRMRFVTTTAPSAETGGFDAG